MFENTYENRIGTPTTRDEVRGHLLFTAGLLAGLVGMFLFLFSTQGGAIREASIIMASGGLALMVAGPVIRLPLRGAATTLVGVGMLACAAAIVWFSMIFPQGWVVATGQQSVMGLYVAGLLLMGIGGIFVPLITSRPQAGDVMEAQRKTKEAQDETKKANKEKRQAQKRADSARQSAATATQKLRDEQAETDGERADRRRADAEADRDRRDLERLEAAVAADDEEKADMAAELAALRESQSRFEIYEDNAGDWRWRLRHRNGNILADGGQGYSRVQSAESGLASLRRDVPGATVLHLETEEVPEEGETFEPVPEADSQASFEVFEDEAGDWRWRLTHSNGEILADSGQGYGSKANAHRAVLGMKETAGPADFISLDHSAFEVYHDGDGDWRWRLTHKNGNIMAASGQGYTDRHGANQAVRRLREGTDGLEIDVDEDEAGEYRWRALRDGDVVARCGEGYTREDEAHDAVDRLEEYAAKADFLEVGLAAFEIYEDEAGEHRWRLRHRNGNILADGGQGYASRSGARDGVVSVKRDAPGAETEDV